MEVGALLRRLELKVSGDDGDRGWPLFEVGPSQWMVISGIGKANAAGATSWGIANQPEIRKVVNVGVAGCLSDEFALGDVIVGEESVFAEEGIYLREGWGGMSALGFDLAAEDWADGNRMRGSAELVDELCAVLFAGTNRGGRGVIATVDSCSGTYAWAKEVRARTGADAEAMEGAGVVLAARRLGRAAAEVRVISNSCGEREQQEWDMKRAVKVIDSLLQRMLGE